MAFDFKTALKKKPVRYALIVIAVAGAYMVVRARAGASTAATATSSTGLDDAQAADATSLQEQQNQIQAQSAATSLSASTGLAAQQENDQSQLALAGISLQGLEDQLNAQTTQNSDALNAQVSIANITAAEQESIANTEANVNITQSNNNLAAVNSNNNVAITNSNNQKDVAITQSNNSSGGGCFITTAVCLYDGEADDCERLEKLRAFRDSYMLATPQRAAMVELYYGVAPIVVDKIEGWDGAARNEVYAVLRAFIGAAIGLIDVGHEAAASRVYREMLIYACEVTK